MSDLKYSANMQFNNQPTKEINQSDGFDIAIPSRDNADKHIATQKLQIKQTDGIPCNSKDAINDMPGYASMSTRREQLIVFMNAANKSVKGKHQQAQQRLRLLKRLDEKNVLHLVSREVYIEYLRGQKEKQCNFNENERNIRRSTEKPKLDEHEEPSNVVEITNLSSELRNKLVHEIGSNIQPDLDPVDIALVGDCSGIIDNTEQIQEKSEELKQSAEVLPVQPTTEPEQHICAPQPKLSREQLLQSIKNNQGEQSEIITIQHRRQLLARSSDRCTDKKVDTRMKAVVSQSSHKLDLNVQERLLKQYGVRLVTTAHNSEAQSDLVKTNDGLNQEIQQLLGELRMCTGDRQLRARQRLNVLLLKAKKYI